MATKIQKQVKLINLYDVLDIVIAIRDFHYNNCTETARDKMIVNNVAGNIISEVKIFADHFGTTDYQPFKLK